MTSANEAVFTAKDIASILPLLQQMREQTQLQHVDGISSSDAKADSHPFTVEEMFKKKKKNGRSTPAQNYLLVSFLGGAVNVSLTDCLHNLFLWLY